MKKTKREEIKKNDFSKEEQEMLENFPHKIYECRKGGFELAYPSKRDNGIRRVFRTNRIDLEREVLGIIKSDDCAKENLTKNEFFPYVSDKMNEWNYKINKVNGVWTSSYKSASGKYILVTSRKADFFERKCLSILESGDFVPRRSKTNAMENRIKVKSNERKPEIREGLPSCKETNFSFYENDLLDKISSFTTSEELKDMMKTVEYRMYLKISRHINATAEILKELARIGIPTILKNVAGNPNTSEETLLYLARTSSSLAVWKGIIENPNMPEEVLNFIPLKKKKEIERIIATSPTIPIYVLEDLARKTSDQEILGYILVNENTSVITAKYIWKESDFADKELAKSIFNKKKNF